MIEPVPEQEKDLSPTAVGTSAPVVDQTTGYKPIAWKVEDVVGNDDDFPIYYRPTGVPDDYPEEWLPGVLMHRVDAETLKAYKATYGGKKMTDGNPERAMNNLMRACFVNFINIEVDVHALGYDSEIEYLMNDPKARLFKEYFMTEFIVREIPSTVEGKDSGRRFK